ncbi:MAG: hypothetical protein M3P06_00720 [Acidobacteriota bacterium]|nr:hypothetical protein [Acidobacteriota bacterium]
MEFILRILFTGLIVFVPSEDKQEVTVLLLNVGHAHEMSDGSPLEAHKPMIVARAGSCTGDCPTDDPAIAQYLYSDKSLSEALDSLETAVDGGAAWLLAGSEVSVRKGSTSDPELPSLVLRDDTRSTAGGILQVIPTTSTEREDFSWVANLKSICGTGCNIDDAMLEAQPPAGLIAGRMTLRTGKVFTYSIARIGSEITPVHFNRLDGSGNPSSYSQAVATWVGADVTVTGSSIEIVEEKFNGDPGRSMFLSPAENENVEIAVLNLPPFTPPTAPYSTNPGVGKHFEMYYEVTQTPPAPEARFVPRAGALAGAPAYAVVDWHSIHPQQTLWSALLNQLRLDVGRTAAEQLLCPPSQDPRP